ncbi:hypothetical protein [Streptomyces brasiliscabiei]|uniref:hypothetical protein n=1 Tax=Streptomyces brasiliscabiei TaxID=2736302 RepID=UPI001C125BA9|nr:hypothetical protein [Streptomyces brasiliscabiei]
MEDTNPGKAVAPPEANTRAAQQALFKRVKRTFVPIRKTFVQAEREKECRHAPLKEFIVNRNRRALDAYLMTLASYGDDGQPTQLHSAAWARLIGIPTSNKSPGTAVTRTFEWLQDRHLLTITRARGSQYISVTLLREDGSGQPYTRPKGASEADRFLKLPHAFWEQGFDEKIDLPGLAMLLAVAREKPWKDFPSEKAPEWYGWSADTTLRGLHQILELGLVEREEAFRPEPLSPLGYTRIHKYNLVDWMRPAPGKNPGAAA